MTPAAATPSPPPDSRPATAPAGAPPAWWRRHAPELLLGLLTVAAFAPSLGFGILGAWDDQYYILNNADRLRLSLENLGRWARETFFANYHPLTMWSYMLDYALWGLKGPGYHLQNLLWHGLAALGVYRLAVRLHLPPLPACAAALLWAVHPLRVESVVWLSERKDVLCGAFYIWGLVLALDDGRRGGRAASFACFTLAVLAKSMAVSFPAALICLRWHTQGRLEWRRWPREYWPHALLLLLAIPLTFVAQQAEHGLRADWDVSRQVAVAWLNLFRYVGKTLLPVDLNPIYPMTVVHPALLARLATASAVGLIAALWLYRRRPRIVTGLLLPAGFAYAAILAPVSGIVPLGGIDFADRYSYLPALPFCLLAGGLVEWASARLGPARAVALFGTVLSLLAATTFWTCFTWQTMEAVFGTACAVPDPNPIASGAWGNCLIRQGRYEEALRLAEAGLARTPRAAKLRFLQARALDRLGHRAEALRLYERLIPRLSGVDFWAGLADCYRDAGRPQRADVFYTCVLQEEPGNYEARLNRGVVRFDLARYEAAVADLRAAVELRPDRPEPRLNLSRALHAAGRRQEALSTLQDTLRRFPRAEKTPTP